MTSNRIAEAKNRARLFEKKDTKDSINYGISRARLIVSGKNSPQDAIDFYTQKEFKYMNEAEKYGLALSYQSAGDLNDAKIILDALLNSNKGIIAYHIALADILFSLEELDESIDIYEKAMKLFPRNSSVVIHYANILLQIGDAELANSASPICNKIFA